MDSAREDLALSEHIQRGQHLIRAAGAIGSQDDFRVWRANRNTWIWTTSEALERWRGEEVAHSVREAASRSDFAANWQRILPDEIARVRQALGALWLLAERV